MCFLSTRRDDKTSFLRTQGHTFYLVNHPPWSVANIFGNWLHGIDNKFRTIIRVGAIALIWSLWLCRNDKVFNDKNVSFLQVIYRCTSLLRSWSTLQRVEFRDLFTELSVQLETTARDIFTQHGWQRDLRIGPPP